jgi:hypothetical protein
VLQNKQVLANTVVTGHSGLPPEPVSLTINEGDTANTDLARSR